MKQNFNRVLKAELIGYMKEKLDRILNGEKLKEIQKIAVIKQVYEFMNIRNINDDFKEKMR